MTDKYPVFSEMDFGLNDNGFVIEESIPYKQMRNNVKPVEFIRLSQKEKKLFLIEAKSTANSVISKKDGNGIVNLSNKFVHSLNLLHSIYLNVNKCELPFNHNPELKIRFLVVIKDCDELNVDKIKRQLYDKMLPYLRIWNAKILVMNYQEALKREFLK